MRPPADCDSQTRVDSSVVLSQPITFFSPCGPLPNAVSNSNNLRAITGSRTVVLNDTTVPAIRPPMTTNVSGGWAAPPQDMRRRISSAAAPYVAFPAEHGDLESRLSILEQGREGKSGARARSEVTLRTGGVRDATTSETVASRISRFSAIVSFRSGRGRRMPIRELSQILAGAESQSGASST
jgi:hypothetical protein